MLSYLKKLHSNPNTLFYVIPIGLFGGFVFWQSLLNNYVVEVANFSGRDIGILQSCRELPGLLAVTALFFLLFLSEQFFLVFALALMGTFIIVFGHMHTIFSLSLTCMLMSFGFHYSETLRKSLATQLVHKDILSIVLGRFRSIGSFVSILAFGTVYVGWKLLHLSYSTLFTIGGSISILVALYILIAFPKYEIKEQQHKKPRFYKRYWIFYILNILSGGRRQLFVVFAPFLMVSTFKLEIDKMVSIFFISQLLTMYFAPKVGKVILKIGERNALIIEHLILIFIFAGYVLIHTAWQGITLYIADNIVFSMSFALDSYFKRIAQKKDIASTTALSFTMNHTLAISLPVILGFIWLSSHKFVFAVGICLAAASLITSFCLPKNPRQGVESIFKERQQAT